MQFSARPQRSRRQRKKSLVSGQPMELGESLQCAAVRAIVGQQMRVDGDGVDRLLRYGRRSSINGLRTGFDLKVCLVDDKHGASKLLYLTGAVPASMKQLSYRVNIWLRRDASLAFARCECQMGKVGCHHVVAVLVHLSTIITMPKGLSTALVDAALLDHASALVCYVNVQTNNSLPQPHVGHRNEQRGCASSPAPVSKGDRRRYQRYDDGWN